MLISVVIPTYKRPELLRRCLRALARQTLDPGAFEVIVCDDGPDEATRLAAEQEAKALFAPVRYVAVTDSQGPAGARNRGWRRARGRIIAFTDDDCIPEPGWLEAGLKPFEDPETAAVMGAIRIPVPEKPTDYERDAARLREAEFPTANAFYRRDVLERANGFDERFSEAWREDADLFFTVLSGGGKTAKAPGAVVAHPVRPAPWGISLKQQAKARFNALLYKKHPRLYRDRIQAGPPALYYAILGMLALGLAGLAGGAPSAAGFGFGAWLGLTVYFAFIRLSGTRRDASHVLEMLWTSVWIPPLAIFWRLAGAFRYQVLFF